MSFQTYIKNIEEKTESLAQILKKSPLKKDLLKMVKSKRNKGNRNNQLVKRRF